MDILSSLAFLFIGYKISPYGKFEDLLIINKETSFPLVCYSIIASIWISIRGFTILDGHVIWFLGLFKYIFIIIN